MPLAPSLPRTILIVDDDEMVVRSITRMLAAFGYQVIGSARSPGEALELVAELRPTVVLIDISLGGRHAGVALAAELMRVHSLAIVFLTGVDDPDMTPLAGSDGVFGFLSKPCRPTALRTTVELVRLQHEARGRLRELERHYHALFEQAAVGVVEVDAGGAAIRDANRKCAEIFATTVDQLIGTRLADRALPEQRPAFVEALALGDDRRERAAEIACRRDDDQVVWVRITASPLERDRRVVILEDITDRHRVEVQLERHRQLLAESQRNAEIGSFHYTYATGETVWSDEMYRLFGVSPATFTPHRDTILPLVHPRDRNVLTTLMDTSGSFDPSKMFALLLADGSERLVRSTAALADGGRAVIGTLQNVTERERAMTERRAAIAANEAKTDFLAHMSHELRTPLNAVLGLSEAMLEGTFGQLGDAQANTLATIHGSGRHLLELINDVLDIARVESGNFPIESDQVLLRPLIDESTALVYAQLTAKGQRLVIDLAPALPPVDVDRRRIKQVLLNLLGNAGKFSPPGTTVTLRASVVSAGREVELAVSDDGPGIDAEDRERIFEPFVTLDPSMSRSHGGAGLGLTLAKRIVELHGGHIRVDSVPGGGATFVVTLPCSSSYAGEAPAIRLDGPRARADAPSTRTTVLLAEDNEATILAVAPYLESQGYAVRIARTGEAALTAACDAGVAVVLMDVQLPGMDGLEVTRRMRAAPGCAGKPVIALTAHAMPGDEERCLAAGVTTYMAKPVRLRQLAVAIERLVAGPAEAAPTGVE